MVNIGNREVGGRRTRKLVRGEGLFISIEYDALHSGKSAERVRCDRIQIGKVERNRACVVSYGHRVPLIVGICRSLPFKAEGRQRLACDRAIQRGGIDVNIGGVVCDHLRNFQDAHIVQVHYRLTRHVSMHEGKLDGLSCIVGKRIHILGVLTRYVG